MSKELIGKMVASKVIDKLDTPRLGMVIDYSFNDKCFSIEWYYPTGPYVSRSWWPSTIDEMVNNYNKLKKGL